MKKEKLICEHCNNQLIYYAQETIGIHRKINKNGSISKRVSSKTQHGEEINYLKCEYCDTMYEFTLTATGIISDFF